MHFTTQATNTKIGENLNLKTEKVYKKILILEIVKISDRDIFNINLKGQKTCHRPADEVKTGL